MSETPIEMGRRHLAKGAERIRRQEALIAELERDGHVTMLAQANVILIEFRKAQQLSENRLKCLLNEADVC